MLAVVAVVAGIAVAVGIVVVVVVAVVAVVAVVELARKHARCALWAWQNASTPHAPFVPMHVSGVGPRTWFPEESKMRFSGPAKRIYTYRSFRSMLVSRVGPKPWSG